MINQSEGKNVHFRVGFAGEQRPAGVTPPKPDRSLNNTVVQEMETAPKVTRDELLDLLARWERGEATAQEVWDWAEARYWPGDTEIDDWEGDLSATNEVLAKLDSMDINLVVVDDVPLHRKFLASPREQTAQAYEVWKSELDAIDYGQRLKALRDDPMFHHVVR